MKTKSILQNICEENEKWDEIFYFKKWQAKLETITSKIVGKKVKVNKIWYKLLQMNEIIFETDI